MPFAVEDFKENITSSLCVIIYSGPVSSLILVMGLISHEYGFK